jgi:hypothetical protein
MRVLFDDRAEREFTFFNHRLKKFTLRSIVEPHSHTLPQLISSHPHHGRPGEQGQCQEDAASDARQAQVRPLRPEGHQDDGGPHQLRDGGAALVDGVRPEGADGQHRHDDQPPAQGSPRQGEGPDGARIRGDQVLHAEQRGPEDGGEDLPETREGMGEGERVSN